MKQRIIDIAIASGSPKRTAAAFAVGVFLSFSPFFGFQVAIGLAVALALRLSRVAVLIGVCANMPWIMIPWYTLTTAAGAFLLRVPIDAEFGARLGQVLDLPAYRMAFWEQLAGLLAPFFWSFLIGSTAGALMVGGMSYLVLTRVLVPLHARHAASRAASDPEPQVPNPNVI